MIEPNPDAHGAILSQRMRGVGVELFSGFELSHVDTGEATLGVATVAAAHRCCFCKAILRRT